VIRAAIDVLPVGAFILAPVVAALVAQERRKGVK